MIFVYKKWRKFCSELKKRGMLSLPACEISPSTPSYVVLKHDVETNVKRAFELACIEHENSHRGSYYVQAYLLNEESNVELLKKMQEMGHEISYHYDVMDSCKGILRSAMEEFEANRVLFESCGFEIQTVCQHGNPLVERVGYTSNRDFFRSEQVQEQYPNISDIMVNFGQAHGTDYLYFSDAGRCFKHIYDPLNNDITDSSNRDVAYSNLDELLSVLDPNGRYIISIHPHRWTKSSVKYVAKTLLFRVIRFVAKLMYKIPIFKKIMSRYYYLAKKI